MVFVEEKKLKIGKKKGKEKRKTRGSHIGPERATVIHAVTLSTQLKSMKPHTGRWFV
jgi:hypothetical protein